MPAARSSACSSGHPEVEIGAADRVGNAGERLGASSTRNLPRWPTASFEHRRSTCSPGMTSSSSRCRTASPPPSSRQLRDDVIVIDCGADFRLTDAAAWQRSTARRTPGTWPYGLPELATAAGAAAGRADRGAADRGPRLLPDRRHPGACPAVSQPESSTRTTSSSSPRRGTSGAGRSLKPHLLGSEVMGSMSPVRGRRRPPAHARDRAEPHRGRRGAGHRLVHPDAGARCRAGILATCTAKAGARDDADVRARRPARAAYDDEPFVQLLPEGQWPSTGAVLGGPTPSTSRSRVDDRAGRVIVVARRRQPHQGHRRRPPSSASTSPSVSTRRTGLMPASQELAPMSVTAAQGFRAAGVTAGLKATGTPDLALVVNDGPAAPRPRVFTSNRVEAAPVHVVAPGRHPTAASTPWSSTPAAPTRAPAPRASRHPRAPPSTWPTPARLLGQ